MIAHGLTPELVPPYPVKPGFSKCLCLHNAYYITYQVLCQINVKIGKYQVNIKDEKVTMLIILKIAENELKIT